MKLVIRYVLLLSLLLVGRYGYMQAHGTPAGGGCYVTTVFKEKSKLKAIEISTESDDEIPSDKKKHSDPGNYFSSSFYASPVRLSDQNVKKGLSYCKHLNYSSPDKYILYGVFRI